MQYLSTAARVCGECGEVGRRVFEATTRTIRRAAVVVIGTTILLLGIALLVLPGPAIVVIPIGLAVLGLEFAWARRWMRLLRERSQAFYRTRTDDRSAS